MSKDVSVRDYLMGKAEIDECHNFFDWFCGDKALAAKQRKLDKLVRELALSPKIDLDKMYVWYKNNCPCVGSLYDDIRFADMKTCEVIYTIVPSCGHEIAKGRAEVWGKENDFCGPLVVGTWDDVLKFFGFNV